MNTIAIGASLSVDDAKILMQSIKTNIDQWNSGRIPTSVSYIDWGSKKRGQGRRSGSTILGSMSAARYGIVKYVGVDFRKYKADWNGEIMKLLSYDGSRMSRYYKAREFGCNQIEARLYAII